MWYSKFYLEATTNEKASQGILGTPQNISILYSPPYDQTTLKTLLFSQVPKGENISIYQNKIPLDESR